MPPGLVVAGPEGAEAFPFGFDGLDDAVAVLIRAIVNISMVWIIDVTFAFDTLASESSS